VGCHKFKVGQTVNYIPHFGVGVANRVYTITQLLPPEGGDFQYRIKSADEPHGKRPFFTSVGISRPPSAKQFAVLRLHRSCCRHAQPWQADLEHSAKSPFLGDRSADAR
jgi:hypothetical protein